MQRWKKLQLVLGLEQVKKKKKQEMRERSHYTNYNHYKEAIILKWKTVQTSWNEKPHLESIIWWQGRNWKNGMASLHETAWEECRCGNQWIVYFLRWRQRDLEKRRVARNGPSEFESEATVCSEGDDIDVFCREPEGQPFHIENGGYMERTTNGKHSGWYNYIVYKTIE